MFLRGCECCWQVVVFVGLWGQWLVEGCSQNPLSMVFLLVLYVSLTAGVSTVSYASSSAKKAGCGLVLDVQDLFKQFIVM